MISINFTPEEIDELERERFRYPDPKVQRKIEVLYLKACHLPHQMICRLCRISDVTMVIYLRQYIEGGIDRLKLNLHKGKKNQLTKHAATLEDFLRDNPPRSAKEAQQLIEEKTGIKRCLTQVREFLKSLGFKYRKVGSVPRKATEEAKLQEQETFKNNELIPRLEEAKQGHRDVFFWMPPTSSIRPI